MEIIWKKLSWMRSGTDWMAMSKIRFRIPSTRGVRGGHFHPTNTQGVSGFLQSAVASNSQDANFPRGSYALRGSVSRPVSSNEAVVAQVPINDSDDNHNLSRRSGGQSASTYDLRMALQDYLRLKGTTEEKIQTHLRALGDHTFKRYNRAWIKFQQMAYTKRPFTSIRDLDTTPITSLAYWLIQFAEKESVAEARCAYAALLLFSGTNALRFEPILKGLKKKWNYSVPHYVVYYDVPKLLQQLPYQEARTESQVCLRLILVFRFFALFRGIDLERTKRTDIIKHDKVWFVMSRRKGASSA